MAGHLSTGKSGEDLAAGYLVEQGYDILCRNWRFSYYEIDIIAIRHGIIHFIEVKTRQNLRFGYPEESIGTKKFRNLKKAAAAFLSRYPDGTRIQFDILSILLVQGLPAEILLIEDCYL